MKTYVKSILTLAFAALFGLSAEAKLTASTNYVCVAEGERTTVTIGNDSGSQNYSMAISSADYSLLSYTNDHYVATIPSKTLNKSSTFELEIVGVAATTAPQTLLVTRTGAGSSNFSTNITIEVTASGPKRETIRDLVEAEGADVTGTDDEPIYAYTKTSGTLTLTIPDGYEATAKILVVGGGGSGAAGRGSSYKGSGGGGGQGSEDTYSMPAGKYTIEVGAGGSAATGPSSSGVNSGKPGNPSSIGGVSGFTTVTGLAGAAGSGTDSAGSGGYNDTSTIITGVTYGKNGAAATSSGTGASGDTPGSGGNGAYRSSSTSTSGAGADGIVLVKILSLTSSKPRESRASSTSMADNGGAQDLTLGEAFSEAVAWDSAVASGDSGIATAVMVNGSTPTATPTMTITPKGLGTTTLTVRNSDDTACLCTWTVTVTVTKAPTVFDFNGNTISVLGATVATNAQSGDLILTYAESGTLSVSKAAAANILAVGGGGGGGGGGSSSSSRNGYGGNGGSVVEDMYTLPASAVLAVTVGAGGKGGDRNGGSSTANQGGTGGSSSVSNGAAAIVSAAGGVGGIGLQSGNSAGSPTTGTTSAVTGDTYGTGGAQAPSGSSTKPTGVGAANTGNGGQGSRGTTYDGCAGGSGIVVICLLVPREEIPWPTVASGLVYDGSVQTGVSAEGTCEFGGTWAAKDAGTYTASVKPAAGYCWPDQTYGVTNIAWSIARRAVTVTVLATNKVVGAEEPVYPTRAEGFIDGDDAEVSWKVWRTNLVEQADGSFGLDESIGTYDLVIAGSAVQTTNYDITYVNGVGAFEIRAAGPVIVPSTGEEDVPEIKPVEGQAGVYEIEVKTNTTTAVVIDGLQPTDTVVVPPQLDAVNGTASNPVTAGQVKVEADATNGTATVKVDITDAFTITQNGTGVTIELNETAEVEVKVGDQPSETIKVKPELTESGDAVVEPLEVGEEDVELGAKTIPGLTYDLNRSTELGGTAVTVASETAKGTRTKLTDPMEGGKPPKAFYVIEVRK